MSRATGFRFSSDDATRWFADQESFFYAADYLRAWLLEAMVDSQLKSQYGARWFERAEAATELKELWASGRDQSADEVAQRLAGGKIDPAAFVERIKSRL
jgi:hypothetical protein